MGAWYQSKDNTEILNKLEELKTGLRNHSVELANEHHDEINRKLISEIKNPVLSATSDLHQRLNSELVNIENKFNITDKSISNMLENQKQYISKLEQKNKKYAIIILVICLSFSMILRFI